MVQFLDKKKQNHLHGSVKKKKNKNQFKYSTIVVLRMILDMKFIILSHKGFPELL